MLPGGRGAALRASRGDGRPAARVFIHRAQERAAYDWNAELSVYLAKRAAGRGLGTTLYGALLALLQKQGVRNVYGIVTLPNPASEALHRRFGFRTVGAAAGNGASRRRISAAGHRITTA